MFPGNSYFSGNFVLFSAKGGESLAITERNMLALVNSPFIVCMTYAFSTPDKLCFILDLMNGGDLSYHLGSHGVFTEEEGRFYACEIILGLEHMSSRNICYRDLKPANILLDEAGHVKISDLGLAYDFSKKKPSSYVGTLGYMAPEVILKIPYDSSVDWFSLGCVIFKLVKGYSPFRGKGQTKREEIENAITNHDVDLPSPMSDELKELLTGKHANTQISLSSSIINARLDRVVLILSCYQKKFLKFKELKYDVFFLCVSERSEDVFHFFDDFFHFFRKIIKVCSRSNLSFALSLLVFS